jgi:hypothetical protein
MTILKEANMDNEVFKYICPKCKREMYIKFYASLFCTCGKRMEHEQEKTGFIKSDVSIRKETKRN